MTMSSVIMCYVIVLIFHHNGYLLFTPKLMADDVFFRIMTPF